MKLRLLSMAAAALLTAGTAMLPAQVTAPPCTNCPTGGVPKKDGTGPKVRKGKAQGQGQGQPQGEMGKRTGPRDGTGPIHTPPQGGRRGGRR